MGNSIRKSRRKWHFPPSKEQIVMTFVCGMCIRFYAYIGLRLQSISSVFAPCLFLIVYANRLCQCRLTLNVSKIRSKGDDMTFTDGRACALHYFSPLALVCCFLRELSQLESCLAADFVCPACLWLTRHHIALICENLYSPIMVDNSVNYIQ